MKMKKERESLGGGLGGCQDGCEWRSEAFVKIQLNFFWGGGGSGWGLGAGGCERRSEACVKI